MRETAIIEEDCEITISDPIWTPIYSHIMRRWAFHKVNILVARFNRGIEKFTNIVGYIRGVLATKSKII